MNANTKATVELLMQFSATFDMTRFRQTWSFTHGMKATNIAAMVADWADENGIKRPSLGRLVSSMRFAIEHASKDSTFLFERRADAYRPYFVKEASNIKQGAPQALLEALHRTYTPNDDRV